jgi:hypothetical protein
MSFEDLLFVFGIENDPEIQKLMESIKSEDGTPEIQKVAAGLPAFFKKTSAYYEALGKFVSRFSQVETFLQQTVWSAARVRVPIAPAIFSGIKIEGCLQYLKRIADAKPWSTEQQSLLEEITNRLGQINKLRNDVLHYGVSFDPSTEDGWLMSNKDFAHIPKKVREMSITPQLLNDASADLTKLFVMVIILTVRDRADEWQWASGLEAPAQEVLTRAWLYKPPPPITTADTSRKARQKPPPRHRASHAKPES